MRRGSVWIGFAVLWAGYALGFAGYSWLRGYNISFLEIVAPVNYYRGKWPPAQSIPTSQILPGKNTSASNPNQA